MRSIVLSEVKTCPFSHFNLHHCNLFVISAQDFLNRLVRDHGSIDLEWLRDIEPDKAK